MALGATCSPIGIDLGQTTKLVQFRMRGNPPRSDLLAATSLNLGVPAEDKRSGESDAFVAALKKALVRSKFGSRRAVITLPVSEVELRPMTLPIDEHDVASKVRWEAESYLDGSPDDHVIDHVVLGEASTAGERRLEVLAFSAPKQKVLSILGLLNRAESLLASRTRKVDRERTYLPSSGPSGHGQVR